jgi:hypothetical protein
LQNNREYDQHQIQKSVFASQSIVYSRRHTFWWVFHAENAYFPKILHDQQSTFVCINIEYNIESKFKPNLKTYQAEVTGIYFDEINVELEIIKIDHTYYCLMSFKVQFGFFEFMYLQCSCSVMSFKLICPENLLCSQNTENNTFIE